MDLRVNGKYGASCLCLFFLTRMCNSSNWKASDWNACSWFLRIEVIIPFREQITDVLCIIHVRDSVVYNVYNMNLAWLCDSVVYNVCNMNLAWFCDWCVLCMS